MGFALRRMGAILGAIGFVSLLGDLIQLHETVLSIIDAFRGLTRPVWGFLLSWLPFEVYGWVIDYLTMGVIVGGMQVRAFAANWDFMREQVFRITANWFGIIRIRLSARTPHLYFLHLVYLFFAAILVWPKFLISWSIHYLKGDWKTDADGRQWPTDKHRIRLAKIYQTYFETLLWAAVILAISYSLLIGWR